MADDLTIEQVAAFISTCSFSDLNDALIENHKMMVEIWEAEDVTSILGDLLDNELKEVLQGMTRVTPDIGINWETIAELNHHTGERECK